MAIASPTDLLAVLKQCYDETVVILRHYPDEFAQRKSSLW